MTEHGDNRVYSLFWLYKCSSAWRHLDSLEREHLRDLFVRTLERHLAPLTVRGAYSLVGLRHDADFMLWLHGPSLVAAQELQVQLRKTGLGCYLENVYTYTGVVPESRYAPEHRPAFMKGEPARAFLSMYPFTKTHEWYQLPFEERRALMAEHGQMGARHSALPEVVIPMETTEWHPAATATVADPPRAAQEGRGRVLSNTINSFGLGDQEFVVAFESDDPAALEAMVEDLRVAQVRLYTASDTPIFLGYRKDLRLVLDDLG